MVLSDHIDEGLCDAQDHVRSDKEWYFQITMARACGAHSAVDASLVE